MKLRRLAVAVLGAVKLFISSSGNQATIPTDISMLATVSNRTCDMFLFMNLAFFCVFFEWVRDAKMLLA